MGRNDANVSLLVHTVSSALYLESGSSFLCESTRHQLSAAALEDTLGAVAVGGRKEGRGVWAPGQTKPHLPPSWEFMMFRANSMAFENVVASSLLAKFKP